MYIRNDSFQINLSRPHRVKMSIYLFVCRIGVRLQNMLLMHQIVFWSFFLVSVLALFYKVLIVVIVTETTSGKKTIQSKIWSIPQICYNEIKFKDSLYRHPGNILKILMSFQEGLCNLPFLLESAIKFIKLYPTYNN